MRVDHCGAYVGMPEQLLHGAYVRTPFEQMRGERMPERVRRNRLCDLRSQRRAPHELLHAVHIQMMPPDFLCPGIFREIRRGEQPEPDSWLKLDRKKIQIQKREEMK